MTLIEEYMTGRLEHTRFKKTFRELSLVDNAVDFCSNDYLGLATQGKLLKNIDLSTFKGGATGSRLISGNDKQTIALERELAQFHNTESALLFTSGYCANLGVCSTIADPQTCMIYDEQCHASLVDGMKLSQAPFKYKFRHNSMEHLKFLLKKFHPRPICIIVESMYAVEGDTAPLEAITALAKEYKALLIVDEAHATGVIGNRGEGLVQSLGLEKEVDIRIHTFGKALGCNGAVVACRKIYKDYLVNFSRPFIYTTALPPYNIQAISNAYTYLNSPSFSTTLLKNKIDHFRNCVAQSHPEFWKDSVLPIQILKPGNLDRTKALAAILKENGLFVQPLFFPTVPNGAERLRICIHNFNTTEEIDLLFDVINSFIRQRQLQAVH